MRRTGRNRRALVALLIGASAFAATAASAQAHHIYVKKEVIGGDSSGQQFDFSVSRNQPIKNSISLPGKSAQDPVTFKLAHGVDQRVNVSGPQNLRVAETSMPSGYAFVSASCESGMNGSPVSGANAIDIVVTSSSSSWKTCTFKNKKLVNVKVTKKFTGAGNTGAEKVKLTVAGTQSGELGNNGSITRSNIDVVSPFQVAISETGTSTADLSDFSASISCTGTGDNGAAKTFTTASAGANGWTLKDINYAKAGSTINCTITNTRTRVRIPVPAAPTPNDACGPNNAVWVKPADTAQVAWTITNGRLIASTKTGYIFQDGTTSHDYGVAPDSNIPCPIAIPATPSTNPVCGPDNDTWKVPTDTTQIRWELKTNGELWAYTKNGLKFTDGTTSHNYGKAPQTNNEPCPIAIPATPSTKDVCGPDNDTWNVPTNTEQITWTVDENGNLTATANDGYVFESGDSSINFGPATEYDQNTPCPIAIPATPSTNPVCGPDNDTWNVPANTEQITWKLENGELIATTTGDLTFTDGTTSHNYGTAPQTNNELCPTPPAPPVTPEGTPAPAPEVDANAVAPRPANAVLAITKTGPKKAKVLTTFTYTIKVRNTSTVSATNVIVRDTLPAGMIKISTSPKATQKGRVLTIKLGNLKPKATRTIRVKVKFAANVRGARTNIAAASADNATTVKAKARTKVTAPAKRVVKPAVTG